MKKKSQYNEIYSAMKLLESGDKKAFKALPDNIKTRTKRISKTFVSERFSDYAEQIEMFSGNKVYCILRSVSSSGMTCRISLKIKDNEGDLIDITYFVSALVGDTYDSQNCSIKVNGCGMDMGSNLVYRLSMLLFGDGYKLKHEWL